mmetsp:Transcript_20629/g.58503  ORF Transcript_20629/g.58503 Transcript_20629/m.58503 type:complete len:207 (+) Transcript_20629:523-1143(+)
MCGRDDWHGQQTICVAVERHDDVGRAIRALHVEREQVAVGQADVFLHVVYDLRCHLVGGLRHEGVFAKQDQGVLIPVAVQLRRRRQPMGRADVGVNVGVLEDCGHFLQTHDLYKLVPFLEDLDCQLVLPAVQAVANVSLDDQPRAIRRQLVHEVNDHCVEDGEAQNLQGDAESLLVGGDGWVFIPLNRLQHLHGPPHIYAGPRPDG